MYTIVFFLVALGLCYGVPIDDDEGKWQWRIVGGEAAGNRIFPYQASLRSYSDSHYCGGIVITSRSILTAGHCLKGRNPKSTTAVLGSNSLSSGGDRYQSIQHIVHPEFNSTLLTNDVAIMVVDKDIQWTDNVQPIEMEYEDVGGDVEVVLTGWGTTTYPGYTPDQLQVITLKTLTVEQCQKAHESVNIVLTSQICTLTKAGEGACHGDSGGPLVNVANGKVAGIVSWGMPCAIGYPDVFTRVSSFAKWVDDNKV